MHAIVASSRVSQYFASNVVPAGHLIQFPQEQQTTIRADL